MSSQYRISSAQSFSTIGKFGAALFVGAPVASSLCYYLLLEALARPYTNSPVGPLVGLTIAGLAFLVSVPMLLIGREQTHLVRELPAGEKGQNGLWS